MIVYMAMDFLYRYKMGFISREIYSYILLFIILPVSILLDTRSISYCRQLASIVFLLSPALRPTYSYTFGILLRVPR